MLSYTARLPRECSPNSCLLLYWKMHGEPLGTTISTAHAEEVAAAKQRLIAVLADPRLRLPDVAAEVAQLTGGDAADEASVQAALGRMLSRSDPAFKVRILLVAVVICIALSL